MANNAALVIDNLADAAVISASTQAIAMPAATLQNPHPSERWRSAGNSAFIVMDKLAAALSDTIALVGLTCGVNATIRVRVSSIDASGAAGDVLDTGPIGNGSPQLDVTYGQFIYLLPAPASSRFTRIDLADPDADYVEAGILLEGLREQFEINFAPGATIQHVDRSRIGTTSSGKTLTWRDNTFRRADLTFPAIKKGQRYGVIERLDRVKGIHANLLLITETESENLARASVYGLATEVTPIAFNQALDVEGNPLFGKQFKIDERI
jgi:hypothetical protein